MSDSDVDKKEKHVSTNPLHHEIPKRQKEGKYCPYDKQGMTVIVHPRAVKI